MEQLALGLALKTISNEYENVENVFQTIFLSFDDALKYKKST